MFEFRVEPVEHKLLPYRGMPVCLIMKDGNRKIGRMTACRKGAVILNGDAPSKPAATAGNKPAGRRAAKSKTKTRARNPQQHPPAMLPFAPLSLEPLALTAASQVHVPLHAIESVLIL